MTLKFKFIIEGDAELFMYSVPRPPPPYIWWWDDETNYGLQINKLRQVISFNTLHYVVHITHDFMDSKHRRGRRWRGRYIRWKDKRQTFPFAFTRGSGGSGKLTFSLVNVLLWFPLNHEIFLISSLSLSLFLWLSSSPLFPQSQSHFDFVSIFI